MSQVEFNLHDSTLLSIEYFWAINEVSVRFRGYRVEVHLRGRGVRRIHVPREDEWGPSESVNGVDLHSPDGRGLQRLAIEMQTGDVIEFDALDYEWMQIPMRA